MINKLFETLASDNGRKFKEDLLSQHSSNETLKRVVKLALDPTINFYIKKIPAEWHVPGMMSLDDALDFLEHRLAKRVVTGDAARDELAKVLGLVGDDEAEVIKKIISRDLKCGVSESTANKVWKGLIPEYPYMRCLSEDAVIDTTDGPMTIRHIVDNEVQANVTTVGDDGVLTSKPIIGWFDNGHADDNWYTITYEEDGVIHTSHPFTGNHIVFTDDNIERSVDSLTPGMCLR